MDSAYSASSILQIDSSIITDHDLLQFSSYPDEVIFRPSEDFPDLITSKIHGSHRRKPSIAFEGTDDKSNDPKKKKLMHRDTERHRRQEMATHYRSLRSLLPLECLKGKRSMSDNIHEAVNYIKHLEDKIQELRDKRDKLKRFSSSGSSISDEVESLESCVRDTFTVRPCCAGVEVIINTAKGKGLPLSRVLQVVVEEGFSITSSLSTKAYGQMVHSIKSEVTERDDINIPELEQKLANSMTRTES